MKADYRHNPPGVPFNRHYHGNRWDAYNPPRVACPVCGSEDTHVVTSPRKLDMLGPRWEFKCQACVIPRGDGPARFVVPA